MRKYSSMPGRTEAKDTQGGWVERRLQLPEGHAAFIRGIGPLPSPLVRPSGATLFMVQIGEIRLTSGDKATPQDLASGLVKVADGVIKKEWLI